MVLETDNIKKLIKVCKVCQAYSVYIIFNVSYNQHNNILLLCKWICAIFTIRILSLKMGFQ